MLPSLIRHHSKEISINPNEETTRSLTGSCSGDLRGESRIAQGHPSQHPLLFCGRSAARHARLSRASDCGDADDRSPSDEWSAVLEYVRYAFDVLGESDHYSDWVDFAILGRIGWIGSGQAGGADRFVS